MEIAQIAQIAIDWWQNDPDLSPEQAARAAIRAAKSAFAVEAVVAAMEPLMTAYQLKAEAEAIEARARLEAEHKARQERAEEARKAEEAQRVELANRIRLGETLLATVGQGGVYKWGMDSLSVEGHRGTVAVLEEISLEKAETHHASAWGYVPASAGRRWVVLPDMVGVAEQAILRAAIERAEAAERAA